MIPPPLVKLAALSREAEVSSEVEITMQLSLFNRSTHLCSGVGNGKPVHDVIILRTRYVRCTV